MARQTLDIEARALLDLRDQQGDGFVQAVRAVLAGTGRVVVMGMGKSGHVGRKIAATLASTGTPALFVHPKPLGVAPDTRVLVHGVNLICIPPHTGGLPHIHQVWRDLRAESAHVLGQAAASLWLFIA